MVLTVMNGFAVNFKSIIIPENVKIKIKISDKNY